MNTFFARFLAIVACVHLLGGHWTALQFVAWGGMLWVNLQEMSLTVALTETFDGAHPCELCHSIAEGQAEEGEKKPVFSECKPLAVLVVESGLPALYAVVISYPALSRSADPRTLSPASPPPRQGQAT